ncbi:hypothetical protein ACGTRS_32585, partial [Burkholderia semiarida]
GVTESSPGMSAMMYLYNPDNFPGIDAWRENPPSDENMPADHNSTLLNVFDLVIDGVPYVWLRPALVLQSGIPFSCRIGFGTIVGNRSNWSKQPAQSGLQISCYGS